MWSPLIVILAVATKDTIWHVGTCHCIPCSRPLQTQSGMCSPAIVVLAVRHKPNHWCCLLPHVIWREKLIRFFIKFFKKSFLTAPIWVTVEQSFFSKFFKESKFPMITKRILTAKAASVFMQLLCKKHTILSKRRTLLPNTLYHRAPVPLNSCPGKAWAAIYNG